MIKIRNFDFENGSTACNSEEKNGECKFEEKKTTSVILKKKNDECNGKKKTASVYSHGPSRPSYSCVYEYVLQNNLSK